MGAGLLQQVRMALHEGNVELAAAQIKAADKALMKTPEALNLRGMLALRQGHPQEALVFFKKAAALDPTDTSLLINIATAQRQRGADEEERLALQAVLDLDQRHLIAQLRLAELQERLNEESLASESWAKVVALSVNVTPMPPGLADAVAHGRRYVENYRKGLAERLELGMAAALSNSDWPSRRRFQACLDVEFGRRQLFTPQCSGLHYPFLPADEFFDRHHFPWLMDLESKTDAIRKEFEAVYKNHGDWLRPYVQQEPGTPQNKWTPLNGSADWSACFLWKYGVRHEAVCRLCPITAAALEAVPRADIPGRAPSAFFSILKPHSHIPAHTGVTNSRAIIHLPLIVPKACGFRVGGETRIWAEGEAFAFDDSIEHEAWNKSDDMRVVLIFDVWNPYLSTAEQGLLKQFFMLADQDRSRRDWDDAR